MASGVTIESINRARNALSKGEDLREEMALIVSPHTNWEDFLSPAPMCICLLGELMAMSTTADFTLENTPPRDGFKLMRWPSSFRASLMQVRVLINIEIFRNDNEKHFNFRTFASHMIMLVHQTYLMIMKI